MSWLPLSVTLLSLFSQAVLSTVPPTITNATGEYYIASSMGSIFSHNAIKCGLPNCYVICDQFTGCQSTTIDASVASSLTVQCTETSSCDSARLLYGPTEDISITCAEYNACSSSEWSSNDTTNANIVCKNGLSSTNDACEDATFWLANVGSVDISCNGYYACKKSTFNVNKAGSVSIDATGTYALYQCAVQGLQAGHLDLVCSPTVWNTAWSCYKNNLYVPNNFNLSCYGDSCEFLGDLYVESTQNVGVYFNGCGVCDIAEDCSPQANIHCARNADGTWSNSDYWGRGSCTTNYCGCNHINNVTKKAYFVDESECPNIDIAKIVHMVIGAIIAIIAGAICCCICIAVCIYFACCRPRKPRGPALIVGGAPYVAAPQTAVPHAGVQPNVVVVNPNQVPTQKYVPPPQAQVVVQAQPTTGAIATTAPVVTDASVNAYPRL